LRVVEQFPSSLPQSCGELRGAVTPLCERVEEASNPSELVLHGLALQEHVGGAGRIYTAYPLNGPAAQGGKSAKVGRERVALAAFPSLDGLFRDLHLGRELSLG
jgi:hypothetical protein